MDDLDLVTSFEAPKGRFIRIIKEDPDPWYNAPKPYPKIGEYFQLQSPGDEESFSDEDYRDALEDDIFWHVWGRNGSWPAYWIKKSDAVAVDAAEALGLKEAMQRKDTVSDDIGDVSGFQKPKIPKKLMSLIVNTLLFDPSFDISDDAYNLWDNSDPKEITTLIRFLHLIEGNSSLVSEVIQSPVFQTALRNRLHEYMEVLDTIVEEYGDE